MITKRKPRFLRPVHPNRGIEVDYRNRLLKLIDEMHNSVMYWLGAAYKANPPHMASDATPAAELKAALRKLNKRWQKRFNELAPDLARYFAKSISKRSDKALMAILKKAGIAIEFKMTKAQKDILQATVQANVALIKSIPQQYHTHIEGIVMRSVQEGRDLKTLARHLQKNYGVTRRRAALIARDQNNKATAALHRARQVELGITHAIWLYSGAGKHPRPAHVAMNGKRFDVKKGMWDRDEKAWVLPGVLINCRCISKSIIPGFS